MNARFPDRATPMAGLDSARAAGPRASRVAALLAALLLCTATAHASDVRLFRPLTADPRESQTRWRMSNYTEDWRFGTDVTDSTSQGGVIQDHKGFSWEAAGGMTFHWIPLERMGSWKGPWVRYQLGVPAAVFSRFDGTGILVNTDYQYGVCLDMLWRGDFDAARGITSYRHAAVTSHLTVMHHSSHLGDEYISQGSFGRNQVFPAYQGAQLGKPPVKRMDLAYEDAAFTVSFERSGGTGQGTLRAYAGAGAKIAAPRSWGVGQLEPTNFRSPTYRGGLEYRGSGETDAPSQDLPARLLNQLARGPYFDSEWFLGVDVRLAKPYNFASADNPDGESEVWTPRLWTASPYGREFRNYAGSWRGMIGTALHRRAPAALPGQAGTMTAARPVGPEWIVALEWYRGYAPDGQLQDQRLHYSPRWKFTPSVTAHF